MTKKIALVLCLLVISACGPKREHKQAVAMPPQQMQQTPKNIETYAFITDEGMWLVAIKAETVISPQDFFALVVQKTEQQGKEWGIRMYIDKKLRGITVNGQKYVCIGVGPWAIFGDRQAGTPVTGMKG